MRVTTLAVSIRLHSVALKHTYSFISCTFIDKSFANNMFGGYDPLLEVKLNTHAGLCHFPSDSVTCRFIGSQGKLHSLHLVQLSFKNSYLAKKKSPSVKRNLAGSS
jgi:hypothetical protein